MIFIAQQLSYDNCRLQPAALFCPWDTDWWHDGGQTVWSYDYDELSGIINHRYLELPYLIELESV